MDFKDLIKQLGERVSNLKSQVNTEEATKNAFIMPFIQALGYDVFNPNEVTPELIADVGIKSGEKIDYAIIKDGEPIILIECKHHGNALNVSNASQLFRYFHTLNTKFAILTNGIEFQFFTDLVSPNKMDDKPFFSFNITEIKEQQIDELKKFHKAYYDFANIVNTASELKYTSALKAAIASEFSNPSNELIKHFTKQVYPSIITQKILEQFTILVKKSFSQYKNDLITDRLQTALNNESAIQQVDEKIVTVVENKVVTTQEELDCFNIIKSILRSKIDVGRIFYRDTQSYLNILLDDSNRKTICRLYITEKKKVIGIFDSNKAEIKHDLTNLDSIFEHGDALIASAEHHL